MQLALSAGLFVVALWLFIAIDWWSARRTRKRIAEAVAAEHDESAAIPITIEEIAGGRGTYLLLSEEIARPIFSCPPLIEDGPRTAAARRCWGKN
jgi:hypothetical protein